MDSFYVLRNIYVYTDMHMYAITREKEAVKLEQKEGYIGGLRRRRGK